MLNELLFTLFLTQVGTVAAITACIVGVMTLFYAEIIALDKCDTEKPLQGLLVSVNDGFIVRVILGVFWPIYRAIDF